MAEATQSEDVLVPVWMALFKRDIQVAQRALKEAKGAPPDSATRLRAYIHLFMGEYRECAEILTGIAPWHLTYLDRRAMLGVFENSGVLAEHDGAVSSIEFLFRCGETGHVVRLLEKTQEKFGESPALAGLMVAAGLMLSGDAATAVRKAREHLQAQRHSPMIFHTLGRALMALGQPAQALQALELGIRVHGDEADARFLRSLALHTLGRTEEALAVLHLRNDSPRLHPIHALAAACLLRRLGQADKAVRTLHSTSLGHFHPLCELVLALIPTSPPDGPDAAAIERALSLTCATTFDAQCDWPDVCALLDLQALARLSPAMLSRVRQRLVTFFPALGTATGTRRDQNLAHARRVGIHLPQGGLELVEPLLAHVRAGCATDSEIIVIHGGNSLGHTALSRHAATEYCVPGVAAPALTKAVAELGLDALFLVMPMGDSQGFALSLARLAPLQVVVETGASILTGPTIDAHCCRTDGGWYWTTFAACSVYDDSAPSSSRLGLPANFRVPLTLTELARSTGGRVSQLRGPHERQIRPVRELGTALAPHPEHALTLRSPAVGHVRLPDVQVWNGETALWHPGTDQIAHEASFHHDRSRIASISPVNRLTAQMLTVEVDHAFLLHPLPPIVRLDHAIVVRGKASSNYFHWLFDGLAALESVVSDSELSEWPLLIDENLHPNLEEALRRVAGRHRVILRQPQGGPVFLREAAVGFGAHCIPYTLHPSAVFQPADYVFCPQTLAFLRQRLMGSPPARTGYRRLFLRRRGGYRHLLNQDDIEALFITAGFEVIDPGTMDLDTQLRTFAEASHIAGPTGAAFSNLLFAPPDTRIILFTSDAAGHHFFSNLATSLGQHMKVVHGQVGQASSLESHQSDYVLPMDLVASALADSLNPVAP